MKPEELFNLYKSYIDSYPIASIQDPFEQDDFDAWTNMTKQVQIQIVGDDLTVTNAKRIQKAVDSSACNCLLLMLNQIGNDFLNYFSLFVYLNIIVRGDFKYALI